MNAVVTIYRLTALLVVGLYACLAVAQDGTGGAPTEQDQQPIETLYSDYSKARFAVSFELTQQRADRLRQRLGRFWYLLLYAQQRELTQAPRVHFGFFANREQAEVFVSEYRELLGEMRVSAVAPSEHRQLIEQMPAASSVADFRFYWLNPEHSVTRQSLKALLEQAKKHFVEQRYALAARYYLVMSMTTDRDTARWARELMALSYEKLQQPETAASIYRALLAEYADDDPNRRRVAQRLRALETIADDGKRARRKSKYSDDSDKTFLRGGFGQTYRTVTREGQNFPSEDVLAIVSTYFDVKAGKHTEKHNLEARINGYNYYDLKDQDNGRNRIKEFYVDYTHNDSGVNLAGGRLRDKDIGVYTPFNGFTLRYPLAFETLPSLDGLRLGVSYGEPVGYSDVYDELERRFFSLHADYQLNTYWAFSGYYIEQTLFGETDRKAYGGKATFTTRRFTSYFNFDYDYEFAELNNLLLGGTYRFDDQSHLTLNYGRQRTPFVSATNILIGQPLLDVESCIEQRNTFECEYYEYFALLRSSLSEHVSVSYSRPIDEKLQLTLNFYQSMLSEMPVLEPLGDGSESMLTANGEQYRYTSAGARLLARDFFGLRDTASLGVRFADTTRSSVSSVRLSERFRIGDRWFVSPKFNFNYTETNDENDNQSRIRGSLAVNYRLLRSAELFVEIGRESFNKLELKNSIESNYFYAGYSARF